MHRAAPTRSRSPAADTSTPGKRSEASQMMARSPTHGQPGEEFWHLHMRIARSRIGATERLRWDARTGLPRAAFQVFSVVAREDLVAFHVRFAGDGTARAQLSKLLICCGCGRSHDRGWETCRWIGQPSGVTSMRTMLLSMRHDSKVANALLRDTYTHTTFANYITMRGELCSYRNYWN